MRSSMRGSSGALVLILKRDGVGREPLPTLVFCGAEDCAGALRVGEFEKMPTVACSLVRVGGVFDGMGVVVCQAELWLRPTVFLLLHCRDGNVPLEPPTGHGTFRGYIYDIYPLICPA
jgi:hypothetical protein